MMAFSNQMNCNAIRTDAKLVGFTPSIQCDLKGYFLTTEGLSSKKLNLTSEPETSYCSPAQLTDLATSKLSRFWNGQIEFRKKWRAAAISSI